MVIAGLRAHPHPLGRGPLAQGPAAPACLLRRCRRANSPCMCPAPSRTRIALFPAGLLCPLVRRHKEAQWCEQLSHGVHSPAARSPTPGPTARGPALAMPPAMARSFTHEARPSPSRVTAFTPRNTSRRGEAERHRGLVKRPMAWASQPARAWPIALGRRPAPEAEQSRRLDTAGMAQGPVARAPGARHRPDPRRHRGAPGATGWTGCCMRGIRSPTRPCSSRPRSSPARPPGSNDKDSDDERTQFHPHPAG